MEREKIHQQSFSLAKATKKCALCFIADSKQSEEDRDLCDFHAQLVNSKLREMLEIFSGDWREMVGTLLKIASVTANAITPAVLADILNTRLHWSIGGISKNIKPARFNSTQSALHSQHVLFLFLCKLNIFVPILFCGQKRNFFLKRRSPLNYSLVFRPEALLSREIQRKPHCLF
jgi:hypothetical protein